MDYPLSYSIRHLAYPYDVFLLSGAFKLRSRSSITNVMHPSANAAGGGAQKPVCTLILL
jgi:hypothetical protein